MENNKIKKRFIGKIKRGTVVTIVLEFLALNQL
jgi:hypothetical protein